MKQKILRGLVFWSYLYLNFASLVYYVLMEMKVWDHFTIQQSKMLVIISSMSELDESPSTISSSPVNSLSAILLTRFNIFYLLYYLAGGAVGARVGRAKASSCWQESQISMEQDAAPQKIRVFMCFRFVLIFNVSCSLEILVESKEFWKEISSLKDLIHMWEVVAHLFSGLNLLINDLRLQV